MKIFIIFCVLFLFVNSSFTPATTKSQNTNTFYEIEGASLLCSQDLKDYTGKHFCIKNLNRKLTKHGAIIEVSLYFEDSELPTLVTRRLFKRNQRTVTTPIKTAYSADRELVNAIIEEKNLKTWEEAQIYFNPYWSYMDSVLSATKF